MKTGIVVDQFIIEIHEKLIKNDVIVGLVVGVVGGVVVVVVAAVVVVAPFVIVSFWFNSASNKDTFGDIFEHLMSPGVPPIN
jgi:hypothetical protein